MKKNILVVLLLFLMVNINSANKKWTVAVYLDGDNTLESAALDDFAEMAKVGSTADFNIVVQLDLSSNSNAYGWSTCKRFYVTQGMQPTASNALQDLGEVNMGNPQTLIDFGNWVKQNYPADHYLLILWDHGDGWRTVTDPHLTKGACTDDHGTADPNDSADPYYLNFSHGGPSGEGELPYAFSQITNGTKWDILGFDVCLDQMWENNFAIEPYFNYFVGSEMSEWGDGWSYFYFLQKLADNSGNLTALQLANYIVEAYANGDDGSNNPDPSRTGDTQSSIDLSQVSNLSSNINDLANELACAVDNGYSTQINNARNNCFEVNGNSPYYNQIDLYDFCLKLEAQSVPQSLIDASVAVRNAINSAVKNNYNNGHNCNGVGIYYPRPSSSYDSGYNGTAPCASNYWDNYLKGEGCLQPVNLQYSSNQIDDSSGNNNGAADPGEAINMYITLFNGGTSTATGISGVLSTTDSYINITQNSSTYPDIASNGTGTSNSAYIFSVASNCPVGHEVTFTLDITADGGYSNQVTFTLVIGWATYNSSDTPISISDNSTITSTIHVDKDCTINDILVGVDISHTYIADLIVKLVSPSGTQVYLHNLSGGSTNDIKTSYDDLTAPDGPGTMSDFDGESALGDWTLYVGDHAGGDVGTLNSWELKFNLNCGSTPPPTISLDYDSNTIDDSVGGNNDGNLDGGETVDMTITLVNNGTTNLTGVSGTLSTTSPYVIINTNYATYPDFGTGNNNKKQSSNTPYNFTTTHNCPAGEVITFKLDLTTDQGNNTVYFNVTVDQAAPKIVNLVYNSNSIDDSTGGNNDGNADAAETLDIYLTLGNTEIDTATNVSATLSTSNSYATINTNSSTYPDILPSGTAQCNSPYNVFISTDCPGGEIITFNVSITANEGTWTDTFTIQVDHPYEPTLSSGTDIILYPTWSHLGDPKKIAYIVKTGSETQIRVKNSDGSGDETIIANSGNSVSHVSDICWSPDDQYIVYAGNDPLRIYKVASDGSSLGSPILFQPDSSAHYYKWVDPNWTSALNQPDGKEKIAVSISGDIWVYNASDSTVDSGLVRITALSDPYKDLTKADKYYEPVWSPDNTQIAFVRRPLLNTNRVAKTDIYVVSGVLDIISGANTYVSSLTTDSRLTLIDGGDLPNYCPDFSTDGTVVSYVKDVANKFNNYKFYTDPGGQISGANFDAYGNGSVLGNPSLNNSFNEGFLKWSPSGGDMFCYVKEDAGNYDLKILYDSTIGGFKKVYKGDNFSYIIKDHSKTNLLITEDDYYKINYIKLYSPVYVPEKYYSYNKSIGSYKKIIVNNDLNFMFNREAILKVFVPQTEIPKDINSQGLAIYKFVNNQWIKLISSQENDTDGNPYNDDLDGIFVTTVIDGSGLYGVFGDEEDNDEDTHETVDLNNVKTYPNPCFGDVIKFSNVGSDTLIKIYNLEGSLVASSRNRKSVNWVNDHFEWIIRNDKNLSVASGIYLVTFEYNGKTVTKKVAIVK